jgi:hypothetical protein
VSGSGQGPDDVRVVRRLDWVHLLPRADVRRVWAPRADAELAAAVRAAGGEVSGRAADEGDRFGLAVLTAPTAVQLREACRRVAPGGWMHVELPARHRSGGDPGARSVRELERHLRGAGATDVLVHGHWPDRRRCVELVPLDSEVAVRRWLARRRPTLGHVPGPLVRGIGAAGQVLGDVSVSARWPAPSDRPDPPRADVVAWLSELSPALAAQGPFAGYLALTPRFRASRCVVLLLLGAGAGEPRLVVKVPRLVQDAWRVRREGTVLRLVPPHVVASGMAPRVVDVIEVGARPALVQSAIVGTPLDRRAVRRDPDGAAAAGRAWLVDLSSNVTSPVGTAPSENERLAVRLRRAAPLLGPANDELVRATLPLLARVDAAGVPRVLTHGDLSHPNLLRVRDGRLGVVDWEGADPRGLPLRDLVHFASYLALARQRGASTTAQQVRAVTEAFDPPSGWAWPWLLTEADRLGVERRSVPELVVAGWVAVLLDQMGRAESSTREGLVAVTRPPDEEALAWVRGRWALGAWQWALEHLVRAQTSISP